MKSSLRTITGEKRLLQRIFILPLAVTLLVMIIIPLLTLFVFSFTSVKTGFKDFRFLGLANYIALLKDSNFINALINTIIFLAGTTILQMILGISYGMLIFKTKLFNGTIRLLMMLPMVISPIIAGVIWRIILMPKYGGVNILLSTLGVSNPPEWLSNEFTAKISIIFAATWEWTPFVILFILAGLESLPQSPFESIKIDGANWFQELIYLTLPMLKKIIYVVIIFRIIEGLKVFPLIFAMTQGGPGTATEELTFTVYKNGFKYMKLGYASAASMFIFLIIIVSIFLISISNKPGTKKS